MRYNGIATQPGIGRGVTMGGFVWYNNLNTIDYITIATTGNATDFGDLSARRQAPGGMSSWTIGVCAGGMSDGQFQKSVIDYITIATTGNATNFGDLSLARGSPSSCSDCHGGLT